MNKPSAQFVEPDELRMLRNALDATCWELEAVQMRLTLALQDVRLALQRSRLNAAWVQAVGINIEEEQRQ
jgi:hypothetical protein